LWRGNNEGDVVTPAKAVIMKYGKQRLYDTPTSRYINPIDA
jgi:polyhydroxyalkanoate synthesis regulator protein